MVAIIIIVDVQPIAHPGLENEGPVLLVNGKLSVSWDAGFHPRPARSPPLEAALKPSSLLL